MFAFTKTLLRVTVLVAVFIKVSTAGDASKSFEIKRCGWFCKTLGECIITRTLGTLTCILHNVSEHLDKCPQLSEQQCDTSKGHVRIILNRKTGLRTIKLTRLHGHTKEVQTDGDSPETSPSTCRGKTEDGGAWEKRLLMVDGTNSKCYQVNLKNKSMSSYSYIVQHLISYVLFISSKNTIWISTRHVGILSYPLDNSNYTRIYKNHHFKIYCVRMAVDNEKNLVFLVIKKGWKYSIVPMTTSGKEYTKVFTVSKYFYDITVLQKDQLIAVACINLIIIQYDGKTVKNVPGTNRIIRYLTVNPNDSTIYFSSSDNVSKVSLNDYKITPVVSFSFLPRPMYYDNRLIIRTYDHRRGTMWIVDIQTKAKQVLVYTETVIAMAILP